MTTVLISDSAKIDMLDGVEDEKDVDPNGVDTFIAKELNRLSMADREKVLFDLHGVSGEVNETAKMVQESLTLLQKELAIMDDTDGNKKAYTKALGMDATYVQNQTFLLKFIRADRFDPHAAAKRLTRFFEFKLDLFGEDLLVKDITQDELEDQDLDALYNGMGMDLPFRDPAGRLIYFQLAQPVHVSVRAVLRKTLYCVMLLSDDEETQRKGTVAISYLVGQHLTWQQIKQRQELNRLWGKLMTALPFRVEAFHFCFDSILWRPLFALFKIASNTFNRVRVREHMGDHKQVIFSLQTFGIPTHGFPVTDDGEILWHLCSERWNKRRRLEQRLKQENEQNPQGNTAEGQVVVPFRVGTPGQNDVLLGRGRACYAHIGNLRLKNIVMERSQAFEEAGQWEKLMVNFEIVKRIKSRSGRFLRDDGAGWMEVDDETATKKVSHCFRTLRGLKNDKLKERSQNEKRKIVAIDEPPGLSTLHGVSLIDDIDSDKIH